MVCIYLEDDCIVGQRLWDYLQSSRMCRVCVSILVYLKNKNKTLWMQCSHCAMPSLLYSHKGLSLVTHTHAHTHTQTLTPATRPYNCPPRDPMATYHHHRGHKENFIYSALLLLLSIFLIWLFLSCVYFSCY